MLIGTNIVECQRRPIVSKLEGCFALEKAEAVQLDPHRWSRQWVRGERKLGSNCWGVLSTRVTVSASFTKASGELSYFRMVNVFFLGLFRRNITKINIHRAQRSWSVGSRSSALWTRKLTFSNLVDAERKWEKRNGFTLAHSSSYTGSCFRKHFVKIYICETSLQTLYT